MIRNTRYASSEVSECFVKQNNTCVQLQRGNLTEQNYVIVNPQRRNLIMARPSFVLRA